MMGEESQVQDLGSTWNCVLSLLQGHGSDSVVEHLPGVYAKNIQISSVAPPPHTNKTKGEETKQNNNKNPPATKSNGIGKCAQQLREAGDKGCRR